MLNYEEFAVELATKLQEYLRNNKNTAISCEVIRDLGINDTTELCVKIIDDGGTAALAINVKKCFALYEKNKNLLAIARGIGKFYCTGATTSQAKQLGDIPINDFPAMKQHITPRLVDLERNTEYLKTVPHKVQEDLATIYQLTIPATENDYTCMIITNDLIVEWQLTDIEDLHSIALHNMKQYHPPVLRSLTGIILEHVAKIEPANYLIDKDSFSEIQNYDDDLYSLTNECWFDGAAYILYPEVLSVIATLFPKGFYILLPATDSATIVPKTANISHDTLIETVTGANVIPVAETLTEKIYEYDEATKGFRQVQLETITTN